MYFKVKSLAVEFGREHAIRRMIDDFATAVVQEIHSSDVKKFVFTSQGVSGKSNSMHLSGLPIKEDYADVYRTTSLGKVERRHVERFYMVYVKF